MDYTSSPSGETTAANRTYQKPFGDSATIASGVIIFSLFVIGVVFNSVTIAVISKNARLRNVFMFFIVSLCVSDLISAFMSPLFWYRRTLGFDVWLPPDFFCKLYWGGDLMTSFSTSIHIFSFSILRYISINYPTILNRISLRAGQIWICCIWFVAFVCGFILLWIFFGSTPGVPRDRLSDAEDAKYPACTILLDWLDAYKLYQIIAYPIFIFLPIAGVIAFSLLITRSVHLHSSTALVSNDKVLKKRIRKEKQAVAQLFLIVLSFLVAYIPFATYEIWSLRSDAPIVDYWFGLSQYFCLRFSECLNPVFYNMGSSKMRRETKRFLQRKFKCLRLISGQGSSAGTITPTTSGIGSNQFGV